eukprot:scaffold5774_cov90-Isochrysis_galbana.AAC.1
MGRQERLGAFPNNQGKGVRHHSAMDWTALTVVCLSSPIWVTLALMVHLLVYGFNAPMGVGANAPA